MVLLSALRALGPRAGGLSEKHDEWISIGVVDYATSTTL
jgi:hypothetical protein